MQLVININPETMEHLHIKSRSEKITIVNVIENLIFDDILKNPNPKKGTSTVSLGHDKHHGQNL